MGTLARIVLYDTDARQASTNAATAFARISELDARFSDYRSDSELSRLTQNAPGTAIPVSDDLFALLMDAQAMAARSSGAFDITVGPLSSLWRRARRQGQLPPAAELTAARGRAGFGLLRLDAERHTVTLAREGMRLDPGGIAKGFAADAALNELRHRGVDRALVAVGGDLAIGAPPPDRSGWEVTLAGIDVGEPAPGSPLLLHDVGVSTSGDAEQWVVVDGTRYSHIVDPRTGLGVTGRSSVSVVAREATTSDMLATAVSVLGPERGLALVETIPGSAALIGSRLPDGDHWQASSAWPGSGTSGGTAPENAPRR
jgi:FAD:protein FMN transferase